MLFIDRTSCESLIAKYEVFIQIIRHPILKLFAIEQLQAHPLYSKPPAILTALFIIEIDVTEHLLDLSLFEHRSLYS
jgi:hypothetical protein